MPTTDTPPADPTPTPQHLRTMAVVSAMGLLGTIQALITAAPEIAETLVLLLHTVQELATKAHEGAVKK